MADETNPFAQFVTPQTVNPFAQFVTAPAAGVSDSMSIPEQLLVGYGRGVTDLGQGAKQLVLHAGGALGLADPKTVSDYDKAIASEAALYEKDLGQKTTGKVGEFLGQAVTSLPVGGPEIEGAGKIAQVLNAVAKPALQGATLGAAQPVTGGDYGAQKAMQVATGAGGGALGGTAIGALKYLRPGNVAGDLLNTLGAGDNVTAQAGSDLAQRTGIDFTPAQTTGNKAQAQLENAARQSFFSRNKAFQTDNTITNQWVGYVNDLMDNIHNGGGSPQEIGQRVQGAIKNVTQKMTDARDAQAAQDYGQVRALTKGAATINPQTTADALNQLASEYGGVGTPSGDAIAKFASRQLSNVGAGGMTQADQAAIAKIGQQNMTPAIVSSLDQQLPGFSQRFAQGASGAAPAEGNLDKLIQLRSYLSKVASGQAKISGDPIDRKIGAQLLGTIGQDIDAASAQLPGDVGAALRMANQNYAAATQHMVGLQNSALGKLVGDDFANAVGTGTYNSIPPETVMQRFAAMKPSEIEAAKQVMTSADPDAWNAMKRSFLESAMEKAQQQAPSSGAHTLAANTGSFVNSLAKTPQQRRQMAAMFEPSELGKINDAVDSARRLADRTGMNMSGSGAYVELGAFLTALPRALFGDPTAVPQMAVQVMGPRAIAGSMARNAGQAAVPSLPVLPAGAQDLASYLAAMQAGQATQQPQAGQ